MCERISRRDIVSCRRLLESVRILRGRVERRKYDLEQAEAKMQKLTKPFTGVNIQGKTPDDGSRIQELIEAREKYESARLEYRSKSEFVNEVIDRIDNPLSAQILFEKYMKPIEPTWEGLAAKIGYSERHTFVLEERAVEDFAYARRDLGAALKH